MRTFENPISISDYILFLNEILKKVRVKLIGEVTQFKIHYPSGHVYFTLKDKDGQGIINCVLWKSVYKMCGVSLKEGMEVIVSGSADIYSPRGSLTFKGETVELVGEGALKKAYDELKEKLSKEGIFDVERKRSIPDYPQKIGVITSIYGGTVIHDFTNNLGKFGFKIKAINSKVEGQEAVSELISSIKFFKKEKIDVLVIIRGGGSLESLVAFDNEMLVREIIDFPVPVITGIGHHKDITLASLAADAMESTPNAVAHLLNRSWEKAIYKVDKYHQYIIHTYQNSLNKKEKELNHLINQIIGSFNLIFKEYKKSEEKVLRNISKLGGTIFYQKKKTEEIKKIIFKDFLFLKENYLKNLITFEKIVLHNNPERQLELGYSIVKVRGQIIKKINDVDVGEIISINLLDGLINSEVKNKKNKYE